MAQVKKVEPQRQEEKKKQGAFAGLLMSLAKLLPAGVTNALGGPMVAGGLVAAMGVMGVGAPLAMLGLKAAGWKPPVASKKGDAFSSMFGSVKSMTESVMGDDAIRASAVDEEEAHPDEDSSLGLVIPDEVPGSDADKKKKDESDSDRSYKSKPKVASYDGKKGSEMAEKMKGRFGSESGLGGLGGGGSSGGMMSSGSGGKIGASNSSLSSSGGSSGNAQNPGVKKTGTKIGASRSSSAVGRLKGAVATAGKGYGTEQTASGYQGAAFGETPKAASIVGGGPGASVSGSIGGDSGVTNSDLPSQTGASGSVTPDAISEDATSEESNPFTTAAMIAMAVIGGAIALASAIRKIPDQGGWGKAARVALAAIGAAGVIAAVANLWSKASEDGIDTMEGVIAGVMSAAALYALAELTNAALMSFESIDGPLDEDEGLLKNLFGNKGGGSESTGDLAKATDAANAADAASLQADVNAENADLSATEAVEQSQIATNSDTSASDSSYAAEQSERAAAKAEQQSQTARQAADTAQAKVDEAKGLETQAKEATLKEKADYDRANTKAQEARSTADARQDTAEVSAKKSDVRAAARADARADRLEAKAGVQKGQFDDAQAYQDDIAGQRSEAEMSAREAQYAAEKAKADAVVARGAADEARTAAGEKIWSSDPAEPTPIPEGSLTADQQAGLRKGFIFDSSTDPIYKVRNVELVDGQPGDVRMLTFQDGTRRMARFDFVNKTWTIL